MFVFGLGSQSFKKPALLIASAFSSKIKQRCISGDKCQNKTHPLTRKFY